MPAPRISVVIPTRGRVEALLRCLEAIAADEQAPAHEVVVVDDEPGAPALAALRGHDVAAVATGGRGPAAARNAGAALATAELVAFTDDDCEPQSGWLGALVDALVHADVAGGRTLNAVPGCAPAEASQRLADALDGAWNTTKAGPQFFATNNLGVRADLLAREPFDERFASSAGEDREWCARVVERGARLQRTPAAVVLHHGPRSVADFLRQQWRYGTGAWTARGGAGPAAVRLRSPAFYARVVAAARGTDASTPAVAALLAAAQAATAAGAANAALRALASTAARPTARDTDPVPEAP